MFSVPVIGTNNHHPTSQLYLDDCCVFFFWIVEIDCHAAFLHISLDKILLTLAMHLLTGPQDHKVIHKYGLRSRTQKSFIVFLALRQIYIDKKTLAVGSMKG